MFGIDFYPTPKEVIEKMLSGVLIANKVVLEPSAGHGNIVGYCTEMLAKDVIACEIDVNLRKILSTKCQIIENDFLNLTADRISHVDLIIMNPPFSWQEKHILHAWDIAPAGCQIISLCNATMIENRYSRTRTDIEGLIKNYGRSEKFGKCFDKAERETGVEIGCVWLHKPGTGENEFEGYFDLYDYEQDEINGSGVVRYDFVQDVVSRYVEAVSMFDEVEAANKRINSSIKGVVEGFNISFGAKQSGRDNEYKEINRDTFKKELQKAAWKRMFSLMKMDKYMTTGVMANINKFVEQQIHVPFTVKNVYLMVQMIAGTHGQRMDQVLVEAFDKICSFSYENSTAGEGWRTNTDFLINKKFILPYVCSYDTRWPKYHIDIDCRSYNRLDDIIKALCYLTGKDYESQTSLNCLQYKYHIRDNSENRLLSGYDNFSNDRKQLLNRVESLNNRNNVFELVEIDNSWGEWIEWNFFRVKGFKKGTMHFEFIDEALWLKFNQRVAEIRGWKNMVVHTTKGRSKKSK